MNKQAFFAKVRTSLFKDRLSQTQVEGLESLLDAWFRLYSKEPIEYLAYSLATAYHETGRTMQPVREAFGKSTQDTINKLDAAYKSGRLKVSKPYWRDGYFGRGYPQLTFKSNYEKAGKALGYNLVANPDLVLDPTIAAQILYRGCLEGWFTGKKLSDYINANPGPGNDEIGYIAARRVVNGTDKAKLIAGYAAAFEAALYVAQAHEPEEAPAEPTPEVEDLITGEKPLESPINLGAAGQAALTASTAIAALDWRVALALVAVGAALAIFIIYSRMKISRDAGV